MPGDTQRLIEEIRALRAEIAEQGKRTRSAIFGIGAVIAVCLATLAFPVSIGFVVFLVFLALVLYAATYGTKSLVQLFEKVRFRGSRNVESRDHR